MRIIEGNLLEIPTGILGHQVNCVRKMGAGLALQIRRKWPSAYAVYLQEEPELGKVLLVPVGEALYVANLYAQWGIGRTGKQTDYPALTQCLQRVQTLSQQLRLSVYLPEYLGCGLAGGDWDVVQVLIAREVPEATVVRFQEEGRKKDSAVPGQSEIRG